MEDLIKAFQIFFKYTQEKYPTHCEHDIMIVSCDPDIVSDEDKEELDKLGFFVSDEYDECFASFRYGSN